MNELRTMHLFAGIGGIRVDLVRAGPAQALAADLLRAEQVIDEEAEIGQQGQAEQPTEGGGRLALLENDVDAQCDDVADPEHREPEPDVGNGGDDGPCLLEGVPHGVGSTVRFASGATLGD